MLNVYMAGADITPTPGSTPIPEAVTSSPTQPQAPDSATAAKAPDTGVDTASSGASSATELPGGANNPAEATTGAESLASQGPNPPGASTEADNQQAVQTAVDDAHEGMPALAGAEGSEGDGIAYNAFSKIEHPERYRDSNGDQSSESTDASQSSHSEDQPPSQDASSADIPAPTETPLAAPADSSAAESPVDAADGSAAGASLTAADSEGSGDGLQASVDTVPDAPSTSDVPDTPTTADVADVQPVQDTAEDSTNDSAAQTATEDSDASASNASTDASKKKDLGSLLTSLRNRAPKFGVDVVAGRLGQLREDMQRGRQDRQRENGPADEKVARILTDAKKAGEISQAELARLSPDLDGALKAAGIDVVGVGGIDLANPNSNWNENQKQLFNALLENVKAQTLMDALGEKGWDGKGRQIVISKEGDAFTVSTLRSTNKDGLIIDAASGDITSGNPERQGLDFDFSVISFTAKGDKVVLSSTANQAGQEVTQYNRLAWQKEAVSDAVQNASETVLHYSKQIWTRGVEVYSSNADEFLDIEEEAPEKKGAKQSEDLPQRDVDLDIQQTTVIDIRPAGEWKGRNRNQIMGEIRFAADQNFFAKDRKPEAVVVTGAPEYRHAADHLQTGVEIPSEEARKEDSEGTKVIEASQGAVDDWSRLTMDAKRGLLADWDMRSISPDKVDFRIAPNADTQTIDERQVNDALSRQAQLQIDVKREGDFQKAALKGPHDPAADILSFNPEGNTLLTADARLQRVEAAIKNAVDNKTLNGLTEFAFAKQAFENEFGREVGDDSTKRDRLDALVSDLHGKNAGEKLDDLLAIVNDSNGARSAAEIRRMSEDAFAKIDGMGSEARERMQNLLVGQRANTEFNQLSERAASGELSQRDIDTFRRNFGDEFAGMADALQEKLPKRVDALEFTQLLTTGSAEDLDKFKTDHPDLAGAVDQARESRFPKKADELTEQQLQDRIMLEFSNQDFETADEMQAAYTAAITRNGGVQNAKIEARIRKARQAEKDQQAVAVRLASLEQKASQ